MTSENGTREPQSVGDVVEGIAELAGRDSRVTIGDVLERFGNRSFAPVMMVFALVELTPAGGIPGVPTFLAVCISLIAVQMLFGRDHIWVPEWIKRRSAPSKRLRQATGKLETVAERVDSVAHSRLEQFASGIGLKIAAAIIIALCLTIPPFEVVPFASTGPMLAIDVICLAIMVRDGLAMLIAWALAAAALIGLGIYYFASDTAGTGYFPF
ncbi:exopolysaccharide biosynthesis protein [Erythrobacter sp. THAF29]|uniref:exopolysaccharide biosynthesis protein n=1 Tax=Erythrobacter sp. THAF29 TaxID=2587851 RepID=UPI001268DBB7|nr:exopolysaccharide biosynthesis protein [Erythrobacter sp. THAF29]QFT75959.1 Exopolysaccharide synthesis, ExoD [Erythrobacter sp. THAF29]